MRATQHKFTLAVDDEVKTMAKILQNDYGVNLSELFRHAVEFELKRCESRKEMIMKLVISKFQTVLQREKKS
jgi:hypothetical protein